MFRSLRELFPKIGPDEKARHLIRSFNMAPNVDGKAKSVKYLAQSLGFDVEQCHLPRGMAGRLVRDGFAENGFRIEVNKLLPVTNQRWAVLHEMGHYYLHSDRRDFLAPDMHLDRSELAFYLDLNQEREANAFAACLLFGDGSLEAAKGLRGMNVPAIARQFGVSEAVVKIGLRDFCGKRNGRS